MLTGFDSLYAGHVDMEDVGYGGTPVNSRWYPNEHLVSVFSKAEAIAKLMDRSGYDTFWLAEHHFQPEGYECIPNVLLLAVHLSHITQNIDLGCGFNISPMWHPLRLAEDYAMADRLTRGRVKFGVGRGYHTREVESFGAPLLDQDANRELFEEQVDIIFKAFNKPSFSHEGKYYEIPPKVQYRGYELKDITLVPRPIVLPVECWQPIQSATPRGLDFMAKHGIKGVIGGGVAEGGAMDSVIRAWQDAQSRAGLECELGENLSIGFHVFIDDTEEQAIKKANKYSEENTKLFGPLRLVRGLTDSQMDSIADPVKAPSAGLPKLEDAVRSGAALCGPPDAIIEKLISLENRYPGLRKVQVGHFVGTPQSVILEQLQRFAEDVMPAFANRTTGDIGRS